MAINVTCGSLPVSICALPKCVGIMPTYICFGPYLPRFQGWPQCSMLGSAERPTGQYTVFRERLAHATPQKPSPVKQTTEVIRKRSNRISAETDRERVSGSTRKERVPSSTTPEYFDGKGVDRMCGAKVDREEKTHQPVLI